MSGAISAALLHERQDAAVSYLTQTSAEIDTLQADPSPTPVDRTLMERLEALAGDTKTSLDVRHQLDILKERAETAIEHVIDLIVVYVVETVLLPLGLLMLAYAILRSGWNARFWQAGPRSG